MNHGQNAHMVAASSLVAMGNVGLSAIIPAIGFRHVRPCPTIMLNHHPGLGGPVASPTDASCLQAMLHDGLMGVEAEPAQLMLTGFFANCAQVRLVAEAIRAWKAQDPKRIYLCDPVMGDDHTGLYVGEDVARAVIDELVPEADHLTPNYFEWSLIRNAVGKDSHVAITSNAETSIMHAELLRAGQVIAGCDAGRQDHAPHGLGDAFSGIYALGLLHGDAPSKAFDVAFSRIQQILQLSGHGPHLTFPAENQELAAP